MRIKTALAYTLAVLMIAVALATFVGGRFFAAALVQATGLQVSPWFTGGEARQIIDHGSYRTVVHRPVFDALLGQMKEGFVQIDWEPLAALPAEIVEDIDYRGDGRPTFRITLNTADGTAALAPYTPQVVALEGSYKLKDRRAVRVKLRND